MYINHYLLNLCCMLGIDAIIIFDILESIYTYFWRISWISLRGKNMTLTLKFLLKWCLKLTRFLIRIKLIFINTPTSISQSIKPTLLQKFRRLLFIYNLIS